MLAQDTGLAIDTPVEFVVSGNERRLAPDLELALYRIAQEALSNVVRHAQASAVDIQLDFGPEVITQTIIDDGRGFIVPEGPAEMVPEGHFGLLGLYERTELIGARLVIQSEPGHGTCLTVTAPIGDPIIKQS